MELSERDNPIKSRSFVIPGVENKEDAAKSIPPTEVVISIFANTVSVLITQTNKIGCMIEAYSEHLEDTENDDKIYEVRTLFGQRDVEIYELIARSLIDLFYSKERIFQVMKTLLPEDAMPDPVTFNSPFYGKTLILSISFKSIKDTSNDQAVFLHIIKNMALSIVEFML